MVAEDKEMQEDQLSAMQRSEIMSVRLKSKGEETISKLKEMAD